MQKIMIEMLTKPTSELWVLFMLFWIELEMS